ncbi:MAG: hypothetical protein L6Q29_05185 [Candidatus Pacebacteria bacterium]|nr:hypothetical protein [Candidatus Paceibacterota bacterium]
MDTKTVDYFPSSQTFHVPMIDNKLSINFPNKCIYCGVPTETTKSIKVTVSDQGSSQRGQTIKTTTLTRSLNISVPYCRTHVALSEQNVKALYRLFGFGMFLGLLVGLIIVIPNLSDFLTATNGLLWGLVFAAVPSIGGGFFLMWLPKLLPLLFKNKTLKHQPSLFSHHGSDLGINFDFSSERNALSIKFVNPEITQEFAQLNNAKAKNWLGKEIK